MALLLSSCSGPLYFDLYIEPVIDEKSLHIEKNLFVNDIETNEVFWNQRIVYKKSLYQVQYFNFIHWAKRPSALIKDAIIQYYKSSGFFKNVIGSNSSIKPQIVMKTRIDSLGMVLQDKVWFAHLALDIEIMDTNEEKVLLTYSFDRKMKMKSKKPKYLPEMISTILKEELNKIAKKLNNI